MYSSNNSSTNYSNTAFGYKTLYSNTTGAWNVAVGGLIEGYDNPPLYSNTTGSYNTAVGAGALTANTTGTFNTAVGMQAADLNTTGKYNVAIGNYALQNNVSGTSHVAIGYNAGHSATGDYNVFIGSFAGNGLTTGYQNTIVGYNTGQSLTTGYNCVYVGDENTASGGSVTKEFVFGQGLTGKGSNTAYIGGSSGSYQGNNSATWSVSSDQRLKKNIVDNTIGLDKVSQIRVRNFEYRTEQEITDLPAHSAINIEGIQLGVIAQELQQILPDCVKEESTGVLGVDTTNIMWHMINAIKELNAQVQTLKSKVGS